MQRTTSTRPRTRAALALLTAALCAAAGAGPAQASVVSIDPNPIVLEAAPGKTATTTVSLRNSGSDAIERLAFTAEGAAFSVANVDCPGTLVPQQACEFRVTYRAPASGRATGQIVVRSGSGIAATVSANGYRPGGTPVPGCTVPRLAGLTLPVAKAKLKRAGCNLGKVTKPAGATPRGSRLVVRFSTPKAGSRVAECGVVNLSLKRVKATAARAALRQEATPLPPAWRVSVTALTLTTLKGEVTRAAVRIFNDGPGDLVGVYATTSPLNVRFSQSTDCPTTTQRLAPGGSCTYTVEYEGYAVGTDRTALVVTADSNPGETRRVELTGITKDNGRPPGCR